MTGALLQNPQKFLDSLFEYDKDNISDAIVKKIAPYIANPDFTPAAISKVSKACTSICSWVRAMDKYHNVAKQVYYLMPLYPRTLIISYPCTLVISYPRTLVPYPYTLIPSPITLIPIYPPRTLVPSYPHTSSYPPCILVPSYHLLVISYPRTLVPSYPHTLIPSSLVPS